MLLGTIQPGKKKGCSSNFKFIVYYFQASVSVSSASMSPRFPGLLCRIRRERVEGLHDAADGGNRRMRSCQLLWAVLHFCFIVVIFL